MRTPRWRDEPGSASTTGGGGPRSTGQEPFPILDPARVEDLWDEDEPVDDRPPRAYQEAAPLPPVRTVLRGAVHSRSLRRWALAGAVALAAGGITYLVSRPGPPTRADVLAAIVDAAERAGRPIDPDEADCVVAELESENLGYDEILSTKAPSAELRRAFDNAYLRCTA